MSKWVRIKTGEPEQLEDFLGEAVGMVERKPASKEDAKALSTRPTLESLGGDREELLVRLFEDHFPEDVHLRFDTVDDEFIPLDKEDIIESLLEILGEDADPGTIEVAPMLNTALLWAEQADDEPTDKQYGLIGSYIKAAIDDRNLEVRPISRELQGGRKLNEEGARIALETGEYRVYVPEECWHKFYGTVGTEKRVLTNIHNVAFRAISRDGTLRTATVQKLRRFYHRKGGKWREKWEWVNGGSGGTDALERACATVDKYVMDTIEEATG